MLRSFSLVVSLPALVYARGANNGVDQANAYEIELHTSEDGTLTLYTYNAYNFDSGVNEFHGDIEITNYGKETPGSAAELVTEWLQFGFCMEMAAGDDENWDCLEVKADLNVDELDADALGTYSQTFSIFGTNAARYDESSFGTCEQLGPDMYLANQSTYQFRAQDEVLTFVYGYSGNQLTVDLQTRWI